jgi:hypothetical protein
MRKLSFLFFSCIAMLALSSCGKEVIEPSSPKNESPYSVIHSDWRGIETLTWEDGTTSTVPNQEAIWSLSAETRELLNTGSTLLVYAKTRDNNEVKLIPVSYVSGPTDNVVDSYDTKVEAGNLLFTHTKTVDGIYETPTDLNNINFRYIIVTEKISALGRPAVIDFRSKSYKEVVTMFNIPE